MTMRLQCYQEKYDAAAQVAAESQPAFESAMTAVQGSDIGHTAGDEDYAP
jgi:hypothetical protein